MLGVAVTLSLTVRTSVIKDLWVSSSRSSSSVALYDDSSVGNGHLSLQKRSTVNDGYINKNYFILVVVTSVVDSNEEEGGESEGEVEEMKGWKDCCPVINILF
ncbi:hypothetical protein V6N13_086937 [Hibiscus sabdariffa]|uniref:Uncharacterized protein n=1 Tax=Hibiscus sabdariffa TaxID=183260 RepID=A0ABR2FUQ0_9ROSI